MPHTVHAGNVESRVVGAFPHRVINYMEGKTKCLRNFVELLQEYLPELLCKPVLIVCYAMFTWLVSTVQLLLDVSIVLMWLFHSP